MSYKDIGLDQTKQGHTAKKHVCPSCGKKRFVRYYDFHKGEYLPPEYGRCDRQERCGYFKQVWEDREAIENNSPDQYTNRRPYNKPYQPPKNENPIKAVERSTMLQTIKQYDKNNFAVWLKNLVGVEKATKAIERYFVGTARNNGTIFWLIDSKLRTRTGQRIIYDTNGHRRKDIPPSRLFTTSDGYSPCLFGEHLLFLEQGSFKYVGIVESEKTALLCSIYLPTIQGQKIVWLAAGGANGLTNDKIKVLQDHEIILCPDFSFHARATWGSVPMRKAPNEKGVNIPHPNGSIDPEYKPYSQRLKGIAASVRFYDPYPNINDGSDIADLLIKTEIKTKYIQPDYNSLILPKKAPSNTEAPKDAIKALGQKLAAQTPIIKQPQPLSYPVPFRFVKDANNQVEKIIIEPEHHKKHVEKFLNHKPLATLIEKLGIFEGIIEPYDGREHASK